MAKHCQVLALFHDVTRSVFLYGRQSLVEQLDIRPGELVVEVGCGPGSNFDFIQEQLRGAGEIIGVDYSEAMLLKAEEHVRGRKWKNVRLVKMEYGRETVTRGKADVVLFSYSLSMIPEWELALACARTELWPAGRIGVVDFCKPAAGSTWFAEWLAASHVDLNPPYEDRLHKSFRKTTHERCMAWAGLCSFYQFVGVRPPYSVFNVESTPVTAALSETCAAHRAPA